MRHFRATVELYDTSETPEVVTVTIYASTRARAAFDAGCWAFRTRPTKFAHLRGIQKVEKFSTGRGRRK